MAPAIYDIPVQSITGDTTTLSPYRGKVLLVVNVASKCGLTPQYDALEKLYNRFKQSGFVVLGFPANDFAGQEPGSNEEIASFCKATFAVDFPMFSKITVTGANTHPLYQELVREFPGTTGTTREAFRKRLTGFLGQSGASTNPDPGVLWNFEKFLLGRDGRVVARFSPEITPEDPQLIAAVGEALAAR
ncbi:MAG: glutathione peroxidase [Acidobacteriaceae bacterium]